ncbi:MAG TPA: ABC transporter permease [Spirochaetota bacterium]|nr:ABC transporter permease [Spirochaetota bacterium]HPJ34115.1 ABC transporter permease [Spirochaetota bacterium]
MNLIITALRALTKNKMRSALTSIGIIIGISSVIVMIGMGNSARVEVRERIFTYGANAMSVSSEPRWTGKWFSDSDIVELKKNYYQIEKISPYLKDKHSIARYKNRTLNTVVEGVNDEYFDIKGKKVELGRLLIPNDITTTAKVGVIGTTAHKELFGNRNPIGEQILLEGIPLTIVGVLEFTGESFGGRDFDNVILIPYSTYNIRLRNRRVFDEIYIKVKDEQSMDEVEDIVIRYMRSKFSIPDGVKAKFTVSTSKDKLKMANDISNALAILLAGIASISLFVGGVGIMNIMLVSVTERTREIGIRMAIGAKKKDIMLQFLIESVSLSMAGGIIGIILGLSIYGLIVYFVKWPFIFTLSSLLVSVMFATAVGIFFGYYPSKKAAELKPIEALKYE